MKKPVKNKIIKKAILLVVVAAAAAAGVIVLFALRANTRAGIDFPHNLEKYIYTEEEKEKLISASDEYIIWVKKQMHELDLYKAGAVIKTYRVNIRGELPDRQAENDGQTPEGVFRIYQCSVITSPAWTRWIAFNTAAKARDIFVKEYNDGAAILSLYEREYGTITNDADIRQFNSINNDTPMLRGFGIHGGGYYPGRDWTLGCPAMNDEDVIELYDYIMKNPDNGLGTYVIITD